MAATLSTSERHSIGDLTLYLLYFSSISTTDAYAISNLPGAIGAFISPWAGTSTLNNMDVTWTNSNTGTTLTFCGASASSGYVYVLGRG